MTTDQNAYRIAATLQHEAALGADTTEDTWTAQPAVRRRFPLVQQLVPGQRDFAIVPNSCYKFRLKPRHPATQNIFGHVKLTPRQGKSYFYRVTG